MRSHDRLFVVDLNVTLWDCRYLRLLHGETVFICECHFLKVSPFRLSVFEGHFFRLVRFSLSKSVIFWKYHLVGLSLSESVTVWNCHMVRLASCETVIICECHFLKMSPCEAVSIFDSVTWWDWQLVNLSSFDSAPCKFFTLCIIQLQKHIKCLKLQIIVIAN